jgi:hypothetical protein
MSETVRFHIGDQVWYKTKTDASGVVTGILFRPHGAIYLVTWSDDLTERYHYDIELSPEPYAAVKTQG